MCLEVVFNADIRCFITISMEQIHSRPHRKNHLQQVIIQQVVSDFSFISHEISHGFYKIVILRFSMATS